MNIHVLERTVSYTDKGFSLEKLCKRYKKQNVIFNMESTLRKPFAKVPGDGQVHLIVKEPVYRVDDEQIPMVQTMAAVMWFHFWKTGELLLADKLAICKNPLGGKLAIGEFDGDGFTIVEEDFGQSFYALPFCVEKKLV